KPLLEGDPRYNIAMRPYDMINVPLENVGNYSMMGNIARPGAYTLAGQRLTVKEAIAAAGGFGPLAWPSRAELVRRISGDEEQIIQLDLDAIFSGEAPDFYLKPNDIVNVGTTPAATFFAVLRNAFRFTYGMGFVYDRNFADSDSFGAREQVKNRRNQEAQLRGIPF
ncbi:MAG: SLBB domain-containing protein, partial [Dehalococcoidia bacterium]